MALLSALLRGGAQQTLELLVGPNGHSGGG